MTTAVERRWVEELDGRAAAVERRAGAHRAAGEERRASIADDDATRARRVADLAARAYGVR